jgi:DNA modification methylase
MEKNKLEIIQVPIDSLRPAEYNPRKITEKQRNDLKASIQKFGMVDPVIVNRYPDRMNIVVGGHMRLLIARELGWTEVPAVFVNLEEAQERELNLRLNKNTGEFDLELLASFDESFLKDVGFSDIELDKIFDLEMKDEDDFDTEAELAKIVEPQTKQGDLYALGEHRLLCGDATSKDDVAKLTGGIKADMVFTDPPYNVDYGDKNPIWGHRGGIMNDKMDAESWNNFVEKWMKNILEFCDGGIYICMSGKELPVVQGKFNELGGHWSSTIIWVKNSFAPGRADYQQVHEPIIYGWPTRIKNHYFVDQRNLLNVWEDLQKVKTLVEGEYTTIKFQGFEVKIKGKVEKGWVKRRKQSVDIWRFDKPSISKEHPCLPAGELVFINDKWQPIEEVKSGKSNYGKICSTSSHIAEKIIEITLADGNQTKATFNHPFLVIENQTQIVWKSAGMIRKDDIILTNKKIHSIMKPLCIKKTKDTSQTKDIKESAQMEKCGCNIVLFGNNAMAKSQKENKSITKMGKNLTIELEISSLSVPLNTSGYTPVANLSRENNIKNVVNVKNGKKSHRYIGILQNKDGYQAENAKCALSKESENVAEFVLRRVGNVRIIRRKTKVYNLTIDGVPAFDTLIGVSHNTMKPIALCKEAIINSSQRGGSVMDLFAGSGSTLIAAEQNDRKCFAMELDPKYVDVIIKRWEQLTGSKAVKL